MACSSTSSFCFTPLPAISSVPHPSTRAPHNIRLRTSEISAAYAAAAERPRSAVSTTSSSTLYDVLGIQTSASCQEIKQAYRRLARVSHPDVASSGVDEFIRIHSAYATLSDPQKRSEYDRKFMYARRRPETSLQMAAVAYGYRTAAAPVYSSRRWETDQCW